MFQSVISLIPISIRILFAVLFVLSFDLYAFQAIKTLSAEMQQGLRKTMRYGFWFISIFFYVMAVLAMSGFLVNAPRAVYVVMTGMFAAMFIAKILMIIPLLMEDIYRIGHKLISFFMPSVQDEAEKAGGDFFINRKTFISRISAGIGVLTFSGLGYGIIKGAHHYKVHRTQIPLSRLPEGFKGLKIGQLSDIHSGSFWDRSAVEKGVDMLLKEKPDIIFFTGDLVNSLAEEMNDAYIEIFSRLKAPMGVYSILGNHDYGDYHQWPDRNEFAGNNLQRDKSHMSPLQLENLEKIKAIHKQMGWELLLNENRILRRGEQSIALIGVENYGARGRFARYGNLKQAYAGTEDQPVKLLLSHDPSHWEAQVTKTFSDIDVMFAGHTHGAQFGIETAGFKWSPVQLMYKQWAGLYKAGEQFLYVNRGFGYLGYPGRLGIRPEIAVLTLV